MENRLSNHLFRSSAIYALLGMALGIHMAATHDHGQMPTHAHLMLFGWVGMTIYAVFYRQLPEAASGGFARLHTVMAHAGLIGLTVGLYLIFGGDIAIGEPVATVFSLVLFANMALFALIVFKATRSR